MTVDNYKNAETEENHRSLEAKIAARSLNEEKRGGEEGPVTVDNPEQKRIFEKKSKTGDVGKFRIVYNNGIFVTGSN